METFTWKLELELNKGGTGAWATRSSAADNDWRGIAWSPALGLFAAVAITGTGNRVMTSPDGINWTIRSSAADNDWYGIAWSPALGLFAAVASSGTGNRVMTSPDGINWTTRSSAADNHWLGIAWSPALGLFAAVASSGGAGNRVMTSPDGIIWTIHSSAAAIWWQSIAWSPALGLFAAVANGGGAGNRVMTSPDGINWTIRSSAVDNAWQSIAWSPALGLFAAVAPSGTDNRVMTSPDGINWTIRSSAADNNWRSIVWSPALGLFVAVASSGTGNRVMTSPDGIIWTIRSSAADNNWRGIAWSPALGLFAAVAITGTGNRVMTMDGWIDTTADVSLMDDSIEVTDGMQSTSLIDLLANPGSLSWVFDNSPANSAHLAGYYTPGHADCRSGFAKNTRVRYSEYYNSIRYYQSVCWLKKPIPSAGLFGEQITRCRATDWLEVMMNVPVPAVGIQTSRRGDQLLDTLLEMVTTQPATTSFDAGDSTFASAFDTDDVDIDSVYSILGKIARSEYGRIYLQPSVGGGGVLKFEHRNARLANVVSLGTISNEMDDVTVIDDAGQVYDRFRVQVTPRLVDPALVTVAVLNYHMYLNPGEERPFTLNYVEQGSGGRISAKNIVMPVASTDYKFGTVDDGSTENLNANLTVTMVRIGANSSDMKARNTGAVGGYLNLFQLRGYGIYAYNPYTVEVGTGGLRVQTLDMPYQNDPLTADAVANYLQSISSNNALRACRVNFHANKSAALMTDAMTGLISTRWTIAETQTALGGDYFINGRKRTVSLGNRLDVEWLMAPAGNAGAWVLGTSALDVDTILTI